MDAKTKEKSERAEENFHALETQVEYQKEVADRFKRDADEHEKCKKLPYLYKKKDGITDR